MTTTLESWGDGQGVQLPQSFIGALGLKPGSTLEVELAPGNHAILIKPLTEKTTGRARGPLRLEDLVAKMPDDYQTMEFDWGIQGREVW